MISKIFSLFKKKPQPAPRRAARVVNPMATSGPDARSKGPERERDKKLMPDTIKWMATLPPSARPVELGKAYPRICNHLAMIWSEPELMENYFNSLLVDNRGNRQGFPPLIGQELIKLHVFYNNTRTSPHAAKAWDDRMLAVGDR